MTATEGLLGTQNGQNAGTTTGAGYAAVSNGGFKFNVSEIVLHFGREYYTMMSCEPERLHCFYSKQSSALHCNEEEMDATVCMGLEEIHERMVGMGYNGVRVVIANIDCQPSMNGAILIFVLGTMTWPTGASRKFAQTFLLAEQPNGYFVLNDIMRILSTEEKAAVPLSTSKSSLASATPKTTVESAARPPPTSAPTEQVVASGASAVPPAAVSKAAAVSAEGGQSGASEAAAAPTAVAAAKPAPSTTTSSGKKGVNIIVKKQQEESKSSNSAATTTTIACSPDAQDKTTTSPSAELPSSWAKLAAVQKNRWGNGVVAESKGPVASIPVASSSEGTTATASRKMTTGNGPTNSNNSTGKGATASGQQQGERATGRDRRILGEGEVAKSVYVHEIKGRIERQPFRKLFEQFGPIKSYDVVASKGIAFIEFESLEAQSAALKATLSWNNEPLVVEARRAPQGKREGPARPGEQPPAPSRRTPQSRPAGNAKPSSQE